MLGNKILFFISFLVALLFALVQVDGGADDASVSEKSDFSKENYSNY